MYGLIAGLLLAAGMVWLVLDPILRPHAATGEGDLSVDPDDDLSPRAVALRALAEIEFDRATGKLSPVDYESLKARYTRDAVDALRPASAPAAPAALPTAAPAPPVPSPAPPLPPSPGQLRCPVHGPSVLPGSEFCSVCGRRMVAGAAGSFCGSCGTPLEAGSQFCARCGKRVAA